MMPSDLPPMEIIDALEEQLDMDFVHFTINREGIVEGIFTNGFESQTVTFEVKREVTPSFKMPPIESKSHQHQAHKERYLYEDRMETAYGYDY